MTSTETTCCVCSELATTRCAACGEVGTNLFFCSRDHQKLVWSQHKRVCGTAGFVQPYLNEEEASFARRILHVPSFDFEEGRFSMAQCFRRGFMVNTTLSPETIISDCSIGVPQQSMRTPGSQDFALSIIRSGCDSVPIPHGRTQWSAPFDGVAHLKFDLNHTLEVVYPRHMPLFLRRDPPWLVLSFNKSSSSSRCRSCVTKLSVVPSMSVWLSAPQRGSSRSSRRRSGRARTEWSASEHLRNTCRMRGRLSRECRSVASRRSEACNADLLTDASPSSPNQASAPTFVSYLRPLDAVHDALGGRRRPASARPFPRRFSHAERIPHRRLLPSERRRLPFGSPLEATKDARRSLSSLYTLHLSQQLTMNFNHPNFEGPAFPAGGAPHQPSSAGASGPHPAGPSHPQPQPHPAGPSHPQPQPHSAPHPHPPHPSFPHPHHPSYPSYPSYPYSRPSLFNWSSTWPFQSHFYASPAHHPSLHPSFAPSSRHAAPPPPPYAHYPQPFDRQAWRRAGRSGGRGRIWPFLLLAGGGLYAYKCLKHEVRDVKLALVETSEDAARVLEESEKGWCEGRWKREDGREPGWGLKEREARWKEWQAQMAATLEKPSSMSSEAKQEASKLV